LYRHIIKFKSWQNIVRYKKHKGISHCNDIPKNITTFRNAWLGVSGIYKITFLPFRLFTYYGSSSNLGMRIKYHYFNGAKKENFLGLFLSVFGWSNFSITVIETCSRAELATREDWYLSRYHPLLNVLMSSSNYTLMSTSLSLLTRSKISARLKCRKESNLTRAKKSRAKKGILNPFYGIGPGITA
jgi:group I intron endonuclease